MSETQVSGGGGTGWGTTNPIRSRTIHFNRVRVGWAGGGEGFHDFHPSVSVGDRVASISEGKRELGQANLTTGDIWYSRTQIGCLMLIAVLACIPLTLLWGLGLFGFAAIFGYVWYSNKQIRERVDEELAGVR